MLNPYIYITIFFVLSSNRPVQPTEIVMLNGHFYALILWSNNHIFGFQAPITNLNVVFISYTSQRLCDYDANYNKNIVLLGKCL